MTFSRKWTAAKSSTTKRGLAGRTSSVRKAPLRWKKTKQNAAEIPIAEKLGGKLTAGSGAVFSDGDIRVQGKYLIEHKLRNECPVVLPFSVFAKIRGQAERRGLVPVLAVSAGKKGDFVVLDWGDLKPLIPLENVDYQQLCPPGGHSATYATIRVNPDQYEAFRTAAIERGDTHCVTVVNLCLGPRGCLHMISLEDFDRLIKNQLPKE